MLEQIEIWSAEVAVVVAFGQLLSEHFLKLFPLGAVNIHGSLLPRWRGAAPIQRSIQYGDTETGVVLQKVVKKLDAGDVLGMRKLPITTNTDAQMLFQQMAVAGAEMLTVELMDYVRGNLVGEPQDETQVTYAKKIDKTEGEIDWSRSATEISQLVRAFVMGPGTWTYHQGKKIKIHKVHLIEEANSQTSPGQIVKAEGADLWVQTGNGILALVELQPDSRNRMSAVEFMKGYAPKVGESLRGGAHV
jgi:methionyl-tRNA formyltransferase